MKEQIVISGISGRFPESDNVDEFWENLINGVDMVTTNERRWPIGFLGIPQRKGTLKCDLSKFDSNFFGIYPKQAGRLDPQLRQLLEVTYEAILDAGVNPTTIRGSNIGVYVGASAHDTFEACRKQPDLASGYDITGSSCCMLANRISYAFDFHGPSFCVDTFCSSSLMALHQGMAAIEAGECDAAIIAGVNLLLNPMTSLQIQRGGALSPDGICKAFDASGNGFVRSDAIVSLFVQKKDIARRSYANLIHSKTNTDGYKINGVSYPSGPVQQKLMEETYAEAGVNPLDVFYVEPHGTGTAAGDPQEVNAITNVFSNGRDPKKPLLIGATKSNMGHAEAAASLCAVTKVVLSLQHGIIPGNLNYQNPNPNIPALLDGRIKVVNKSTTIESNLIGINSTGVGGSNIHVIIEANLAKNDSIIPITPVLIPVSGRTDDAVKYALRKVKTKILKVISKTRNVNFESLLQKLAEDSTPGHEFRGYTILGGGGDEAVVDVQPIPTEKLPLWFVFSGMGTLWKGMTEDLMEFEMFAESIRKSAEILKPFGLDLYDIMTNGNDELLNKNMGKCFIAVGVALIDMLTAVGLRPDGFIGHSSGELLCGYIDGCISQKDALICYFFKDECIAKCTGGGMAAVGLSWEEARKRCPEGVYPACHNGEKNVTISGPAEDVRKFIEKLKSEEIFAREVSTGGVAYHSPYLAPIIPTFEAHTRAVVTNPKPRSNKWISSSIPEEQWENFDSKLGSAQYVVNNMRSPVLFHGAVKHIPENAVVVEVSAHSLFISLLKKALPSTCTVMGLVRKGSGNNAAQFLTAVGKLYQLGYNPKLSALYKPVQFPVPADTPAISPLVKWDHSITYPLPDYIFNSAGAGNSTVEVSLGNETESYLAGHTIDGRILYPATGYLTMVWKKFSSMNGKPYLEFPVEFQNVRFERATILPKEGGVKFQISIRGETGKFQIQEGDSTVVTGIVKLGQSYKNMNDSYLIEDCIDSTKYLPLTNDDIYKEFRLQGYEFQQAFKGIKLADNEGKWAKISWEDNWVLFLDAMCQLPILFKDTKGFCMPIKLQRVVIDPFAFKELVDNNLKIKEEGVLVNHFKKYEIIKCRGIEIKGLRTSIASRRPVTQNPPVLEIANFTPYFEEGSCLTLQNMAKFFLDLFIENTPTFRFNIQEKTDELKFSISRLFAQLIQIQPLRKAEFTIVSDDTDMESRKQLETIDMKVVSKNKADKLQYNFIILNSESDLSSIETTLKDEGFVLYHAKSISQINLKQLGLNSVAQRKFENRTYSLFKKASKINSPNTITINIQTDNFKWLPEVRDAMKNSSSEKDFPRIYLRSENAPTSGIVGLVNCLRQEPGGHKIRCIFSLENINEHKNVKDDTMTEILKNDLVMNIIDNNGVSGSFRHLPVQLDSLTMLKTRYAYINVETKGDLSSLKFIEAPVPIATTNTEICEVNYSPLNFRDVMLATGRLPPEALPGKLGTQECILGLEFVGRNKNGDRVMGMVEAKGLATHVAVDPVFLWKVPTNWSMEDAATIPVAYSTAYYSLIIRGRMKSGESVLIHSGSEGMGQAAISIALSMNCTVYTSVGSENEKRFLMEQFPQLKDHNFTNSRNITFEQHIAKYTDGRGVDLVLNSLSEEKLKSSIRCLSEGGRFLEIGKFDLSKNNSLGLLFFFNNVTFHRIMLDALFEKQSEDKYEVVKLVENGIKSGTVRPLPRIVFRSNEIEDAFRFMDSGKHMGKVLLKIRDEVSTKEESPTIVNSCVRTYFDPSKVYIIIGGLGGFGLELASWMIRREAKKIVLVSRSTVKNGYQSLSIRRWTEAGVTVSVVQTDITSLSGAERLIQESQKIGIIGGIFNLAMVLKDGFIENQTVENFEEVTNPKIKGTHFLDVVSRKLCQGLEYFVVFSSVVSGRGNVGQSNYGFANSTMERICEKRKNDGLPALAIQWGAIGDVGVVQDLMGGNDVVLGGTVPQRLNSCLQVLDLILRRNDMAIVSSTVFPESSIGKSTNADKPSLLTSVAKIMGLKNSSSVSNRKLTFREFGIDSLMTVELKQLLEYHSNVTLSLDEIRELNWEKLEELDF